MKKVLQMSAIALALASLSTGAMAKDNGKGQGKGKGQKERAEQVRRDSNGDNRRYHVYQGQRYPIVVRDGRDYYHRGGRYYPVVVTDGGDRRYHEQSGQWDNGRRGPPSWAKGKNYKSYGYERVVIVPAADYGRYDLYRPRDGYRWVRDDAGHYLLVSIASGIISDILTRRL